MRGTAVARAAVAGLTLGLSALAALAVFGTARTSETTAYVRSADQVSEYWSRTFLQLNIENDALNSYLQDETQSGPNPLKTAIGAAGPSLEWLTTHGLPEDMAAARTAQRNYRSYTENLTEFIRTDGLPRDSALVALEAEQAGMAASSLQKQAVSQMTRKRLTTYEYLTRMENRTKQLRFAAVGMGILDLVLLGFCAAVLLGHQRRTERQAVRDGLTGLANRGLLADRMQLALRMADRYGEPVGLLAIDLNRFKEINDTLGHHAGDLLLQEVATRLSGVVRDCDTVARLGGDEFAVLLPRVGSVADLSDVARRVLDALQLPVDLDGTMVDVRCSVGAALYPEHSTSAMELTQHADSAMYHAKRGKLGSAVYEPSATATVFGGHRLLAELRRALERKELVLHYQPKARTDSAQVCGVEALVRWEHPVRGLVPPGEFIPLAESSELIHPLTDYVIAAALEQHRAWRRDGLILPIAVNITAHSLLDMGFPERLAALVAEHEMDPSQLTLELTESTAVTDSPRAVAVLQELRATGIRLSIDDFGAAYSSMSYLRTLPLNELKIDRQFIMSALSSPGNAAIVRAILELARALDLDVVAEGVEDKETLAALEEMGCAIAQGFYLCRPMPARALEQWLAAQPGRLHGAHDLANAEPMALATLGR